MPAVENAQKRKSNHLMLQFKCDTKQIATNLMPHNIKRARHSTAQHGRQKQLKQAEQQQNNNN